MENNPVQVKNEVKKGMPKQTFAFVGFLIVVTLVLLGLAVYTQVPQLPSPSPKASGIVFPSYAHTVLSLTPPANDPILGRYTTDVFINTNKDRITAIQLEMSFDPKVLTNVDIKPGTFIPNPVVLLKKVDQTNGRISLSFAISPGQTGITGAGPVATISFKEVETAKGTTIIDFLPKTEVTALGVAESVLKQSTATLFSVNPTPVPGASTSPVYPQ